MASEWNDRKQNSSYRGKCQWNFNQGKGDLVRVSGLLAAGSSSYIGVLLYCKTQ